MSDRTCTVDGCEKPHFGRGLCNQHYSRVRRGKGVGTAEPQRMSDRGCKVEGCAGKHNAKGLCATHYIQWRIERTEPVVVTDGGSVGYTAAHRRVSLHNGPAAKHQCMHCGAEAKQWAYDNADPNEMIANLKVRKSLLRLRYSQDPSHYIPLCIQCHRVFDKAARSGEAVVVR